MAINKEIAGEERIKAQLFAYGTKKLARIAEAVEESGVVVANHAKANHIQGQAHAQERYENQTDLLTTSITTDLVTANDEEITAEVWTNVEYAWFVEASHPYMFVALHESRDDFQHRVSEAMR